MQRRHFMVQRCWFLLIFIRNIIISNVKLNSYCLHDLHIKKAQWMDFVKDEITVFLWFILRH